MPGVLAGGSPRFDVIQGVLKAEINAKTVGIVLAGKYTKLRQLTCKEGGKRELIFLSFPVR